LKSQVIKTALSSSSKALSNSILNRISEQGVENSILTANLKKVVCNTDLRDYI